MDRLSKAIESAKQAYERLDDTAPDVQDRRPKRDLAAALQEANLPRWDWCRFGSEKFNRRTRRAGALHAACQTWSRQEGSLVLSGPTGVGKTLCLVALGRKLVDLGRTAVDDGLRAWLGRVRFLRASDLVHASQRHPLGMGEPPLLSRAVGASLLLLDDVGNEGPDRDRSLFEVIDRRYMAGAPTVATTYLSRAELGSRYGDALLRRLTDQGRFITPEGP